MEQQGLAPAGLPTAGLAGEATPSGTESTTDNIGTGGTGCIAGVMGNPTAGSTMGVTIAGKTPTSKRACATSRSMPEVVKEAWTRQRPTTVNQPVSAGRLPGQSQGPLVEQPQDPDKLIPASHLTSMEKYIQTGRHCRKPTRRQVNTSNVHRDKTASSPRGAAWRHRRGGKHITRLPRKPNIRSLWPNTTMYIPATP